MEKNFDRLIYTLVYFAIMYISMKIIGFEFSILIGVAWLNADNAVNEKQRFIQ